MEKLENVKYELLNYSKYKERLNQLLKDPDLIELGLEKVILGKTSFGYDIDCITIGYGDKHLFIVGGTHGSEIISVDFVTQLIGEVKNFTNFDANEFKLFIVPNQNPEGFIVTTDSLMKYNIDTNLEPTSKEYFYRYKTDNIISFFVRDFNQFIDNLQKKSSIVDPNVFLEKFKCFLNTNEWMSKLKDKKNGTIPEVNEFLYHVNQLSNIDNYTSLKLNLLQICNKVIEHNMNNGNYYLIILMRSLKNYFEHNEFITNKINQTSITKLHQDMFKSVGFDSIYDEKLSNNIKNMYDTYHHPLGSQVTYDATGVGINLNANNNFNPGIEAIKNGKEIFGVGAKNNVKNYTPGPLGVPTLDVNYFEYATENKVLYEIMKKSYVNGNYIGTILYHGTGGMIFYKPYQGLMNDKDYEYFIKYNQDMANIYQKSTGYRIIESSDTSGYGDLLRRTFPGVLLVELSKMGGNPISPYGDKNNIYNTYFDNYHALDELIGHFLKKYRDINNKKKI
jgi:hypothetical protein